MKRAILSSIWPAILVLALIWAPRPGLAANGAARAAHAKKGESFLTGEPFTLDQVLLLLKDTAIPLRRRKEAVENRGVAFSLSSDTLAKLESAGASGEILEVIKSKAKPAPPQPPPPPKIVPKGGVDVNCAPAECQVSLNGTSIGATSGGRLQASGLTPGKWVVDFSKEGFLGNQASVLVESGKTSSVSVTLAPDPAARAAFGAQLFQKMLQTLGGQDGLKTLASVQAVGSTTLWSRDGRSVRWTLLMRNRADRGLFQVKSGKLLHEVMFTGSEFKASKNIKGEDALEMPTDFGLIRDNQLPALISKLENGAFKMVADHATPGPGDGYALVADSGTETISIAFDAKLRPERVKLTTAAGLGSALITYSDYVQNGNTFYPKTMLIKPDKEQQGIEVRFDTVELNPNLTDPDYRLRGKPFLNIE